MSNPYIPLEPEKIYHVYTHANGSENLFREEDNYRYFLEKYGQYVHPIAETFAYCLMLHLIIGVNNEEELIKFFNLKILQGFQTLGGLAI